MGSTCDFTRVYTVTRRTGSFPTEMSTGSRYFLSPSGVARRIGSCYHEAKRGIPRALKRVTAIVCADLTRYCTGATGRLRRVANEACDHVRVINNNSGTKCLGRLATGTAGGRVRTNPKRTATVKGVATRVLGTRRFGAVRRTHAVVRRSFNMGICGWWGKGETLTLFLLYCYSLHSRDGRAKAIADRQQKGVLAVVKFRDVVVTNRLNKGAK